MSTLAKLKADKRVQGVPTYRKGTKFEAGEVFVWLAPGWHWSQQRSFGCDTLKEAWSFVREAEYDPEGYGKADT